MPAARAGVPASWAGLLSGLSLIASACPEAVIDLEGRFRAEPFASPITGGDYSRLSGGLRDTSRGIRTFRPRSFTVVSSTAGTAPNHERERPRGKSRKRHLQCHRYSAAVPRRVRTVPASVLWPCCGLDVARRRSR